MKEMEIAKKIVKSIAIIQFLAFVITLFAMIPVVGMHGRTPMWLNYWGLYGLIIPFILFIIYMAYVLIKSIWKS